MILKLKKNTNSTLYMSIFVVFLFLLFVSNASAQAPQYVPLVGIPNVPAGTNSIPTYINAIYLLTITLGSLYGVLRIAWAGVKYSLSDIVTDKETAKKDIKGVLLGLAILLIPFIVLRTINPNLTSLNILQSARQTNLNVPSQGDPTVAAQQQSQRVGNLCQGQGAGQSGCPANISDAARSAQASCQGFYDFNLNKCFTADSNFIYSGGGSNDSRAYSTHADMGWFILCGGAKENIDKPGEVEKYVNRSKVPTGEYISCKK